MVPFVINLTVSHRIPALSSVSLSRNLFEQTAWSISDLIAETDADRWLVRDLTASPPSASCRRSLRICSSFHLAKPEFLEFGRRISRPYTRRTAKLSAASLNVERPQSFCAERFRCAAPGLHAAIMRLFPPEDCPPPSQMGYLDGRTCTAAWLERLVWEKGAIGMQSARRSR